MRHTLLLVLLAGCGSADVRDAAVFRAGTAKIKITPEKYGWMTGYGGRNRPAEGVTAELWARALALEDSAGSRAVLVTADILGFPPDLNREIRRKAKERFGLSDEQLMLVASHTHGGPALPQRPSTTIFLGLDDAAARPVFEYAEWLTGRILEAVDQALGSMAPARVSFDRRRATFGMNRRLKQPDGSTRLADNPAGLTDPDVPALWVAGKAVVFTYACHCTTLGGNVYTYHGDYAGVAAEAIERKRPGLVALFATGCAGDINPSPRGTFELAAQHGQALADAVVPAGQEAGRPVSGPLRMAYGTVDLPLEPPPARELLEKLQGDKNVFRKRHAAEMLKLLDAGTMPRAVPLPLQVWRLGDVTLVAIGGEVCVEYALRLKRELGPADTWVVGYANEVPCYIPSEKVLGEGGYEAGWDAAHGRAVAAGSMIYYGWPVPFAAGVEDRVVRAARALVDRISK
jgi:hypothetical protein